MDHTLRAVPRQERSGQAIDTILDATHTLASTIGLDELTIGRVAKEAGVSAGKVYYWFEDKDALLEAARSRTQDEFETFLRKTLDFVDIEDASWLVDNYVRQFAKYMIKNPTALDLLNRDRADTGTNPFRELMVDLVVPLVSIRVEGMTDAEARFVVRNLVNVMITLTGDVVGAKRSERSAMITEMVYLLYGYLHARYPHESDQVWSNPDYPVQPARPVCGLPRSTPMYPADI